MHGAFLSLAISFLKNTHFHSLTYLNKYYDRLKVHGLLLSVEDQLAKKYVIFKLNIMIGILSTFLLSTSEYANSHNFVSCLRESINSMEQSDYIWLVFDRLIHFAQLRQSFTTSFSFIVDFIAFIIYLQFYCLLFDFQRRTLVVIHRLLYYC